MQGELRNNKKKVLIYGTIARPRSMAVKPAASGWRQHIKSTRDRLLWAVNSTATLDYRNYDVAYPSNLGDIAISEAIRNQLRFEVGELEFVNLNWGELDHVDMNELTEGVSLIVIAGSGYFHFANDGRLASRVARDADKLGQVATPVVVYGVGVNRAAPSASVAGTQQIDVSDEGVLRSVLGRASMIGVRGMPSCQTLQPYSDKPVRVVCDPALFLNPSVRRGASRKGTERGVEAPRIGVNFAFHGPLSSAVLQRNLPIYVRMLRIIQAETGCSFHYFIHNHTEWIIPRLLRDKGIDVETVAGDPYELSSRYAEMNIHLGGMLHSCILATGAGTPCVLLAYDTKHFDFAELLDQQAHCHLATTLDEVAVLGSMRNLLANEAEVRRRLDDRLEQLWVEQESFLRDCAGLIGSPGVSR